eukprot:TRINITY_DN43199_c0_g1_i1.p1 TRINITY_DN43199_c0_g1~~TRINITY_DN43199_c0_g1_i1.p1  ORF type:complete len:264 (+),score=67.05 TRINITY_DN43199_c0_g1_i1:100-891(+)
MLRSLVGSEMCIRDSICTLQEFDFAPSTEGFEAMYTEALGEEYHIALKQRTGSKQEGLAMLLRKEVFDQVEVSELELSPRYCDRVAIIATMRHIPSNRRVMVANTHLTVAHAHTQDIPVARPTQMKQLLEEMEHRCEPGQTRLLCGDMNADHLETESPGNGWTAVDVAAPIIMAMEAGYFSSLHAVLPEGIRPISHTSSYSQDGCCDYVLFRDGDRIGVEFAQLMPQGLAVDQKWSVDTGWSEDLGETLSDHRPLYVGLRLQP